MIVWKKSNSKNTVVTGELNDSLKLTKFTVYIGQEEKEILGKYGDLINPLIKFTLHRKNLIRPLFIAIYQGEGDSIQKKDEQNNAYILALAGFRKNIDNSMDSLYLYGKETNN